MDELQHSVDVGADQDLTESGPQKPDPDNAVMVNATLCLAVECPRCGAKVLAQNPQMIQAAIFGQRFLAVCACGVTHAVGLGGMLIIPMQAPQQSNVVRPPKSNREFLQMIKDRR